MRTIIRGTVVAATAALAIGMGGSAFAAAPDGSYNFKDNGTNSHGNCVGVFSSQITQNGQFVSGQPNDYGIDQTSAPGSRAAAVHAAQAGGC